MLPFPAPPGQTAPLFPPAPRDLPFYPLDEEIHRFVCEVYANKYEYHRSRGLSIIDDFLLRLRAMSTRITSCTDLDLYFIAIYRLLSEKPENERISPYYLRKFWKDYSLTSRQMASDNACEALRLVEGEHAKAYAKYYTTLLSCEHDAYVVVGFRYKTDVVALKDSLKLVLDHVEVYNLAAKQLRFVKTHEVYLPPSKGDSPL